MLDTSLYPYFGYCEKLKEGGFALGTEKSYIRAFNENRPLYGEYENIIIDSNKKHYYEGDVDIFPCPSIGEIIMLLPKKLHIIDMDGIPDGIYFLFIYPLGSKYVVAYQWRNGDDVFDYVRNEEGPLPDALIKMLLFVQKYKNEITPSFIFPTSKELNPIYFYPNNA